MRALLDSERTEWSGIPVRPIVLCALVVHLIAAWFNGGYLNADEHYQIIEFAQYKLGHQSAAGLAWEFQAQMRPALQPWLATGAIRLAHAAGIQSPFLIALGLRLLSTLLALWVTLELCSRCLRTVTEPRLKLVGLLVALFLWVTPSLHGRFGAETWGGALLAGGLCLMLDASDAWPAQRARSLRLASGAGLAWSAAFFCRFQVGAAIGGAGLWLLAVRRRRLAVLSTITGTFLVGGALNVLLDHWLYDTWTLTPYRYYVTNILQGKAATFGTEPWWMMAVYLTVLLIPPYSLAVLAVLSAGIWCARRHVLVWATMPFVLLHTVVSHKEPRFLAPIVFLIGPLLAISGDALPARFKAAFLGWLRTRAGRTHLAAVCTLNLLLLSVVMFLPASDTYRIDRWLWKRGQEGPFVLYTLDQWPTPFIGPIGPTSQTFYGSGNVTLAPITSADQLRAARIHRPAYVYYRGFDPPFLLASVGVCAPLQRGYPVWLARLVSLIDAGKVQLETICRLDATR